MDVSTAVCPAGKESPKLDRPPRVGIPSGEGHFWPVHQESVSPDGLTEQLVDALLIEVDAVVAAQPGPTSALLDGSAAERRRCRMERRAVAAVIRALPACGGASGPAGREAA